MSVEAKVGLFFCVGIIILGVLTLKVENFRAVMEKKYPLRAYFGSAAGLERGDAVAIAGVKVGEVTDVRIAKGKVEVLMAIRRGAEVKADSVAIISASSLLGGKFVDISLGSPDAPPLEPNSVVASKDTPDVNALLEKIEAAVGGIADLTDSFRKQFEGGQDFFKSLSEAGPKLQNILTSLEEITAKIKSGEGTVGKLVYDESLYNDARDIAAALKASSERLARILADNQKTVSETLASLHDTLPELRDSIATLKRIAEKIEKGEGTVGKLVSDRKLYDELTETVRTARTLLARIEKGEGALGSLLTDEKFFEDTKVAIASLRSVAEKIDKGEGTIGKLINDPSLYDEMKKIVQEGREAVRGAKEQIPIGAFTSVLFSAF